MALTDPRTSEEPGWQERLSEGVRQAMRGWTMTHLGGHLTLPLSGMGHQRAVSDAT